VEGTRGFLDIQRINVPLRVTTTVHTFLRRRGLLGLEAVAFWAGVQQDCVFEVMGAIIPDQDAQATDEGLSVLIGRDALFRMNVEMHARHWALMAQIHSHPTEAYHSETDDAFSVITRVGGLSIVVPDFASSPIDITTWSVHRLNAGGKWCEISDSQVGSLINLAG
jgi:hypothetical protein